MISYAKYVKSLKNSFSFVKKMKNIGRFINDLKKAAFLRRELKRNFKMLVREFIPLSKLLYNLGIVIFISMALILISIILWFLI